MSFSAEGQGKITHCDVIVNLARLQRVVMQDQPFSCLLAQARCLLSPQKEGLKAGEVQGRRMFSRGLPYSNT